MYHCATARSVRREHVQWLGCCSLEGECTHEAADVDDDVDDGLDQCASLRERPHQLDHAHRVEDDRNRAQLLHRARIPCVVGPRCQVHEDHAAAIKVVPEVIHEGTKPLDAGFRLVYFGYDLLAFRKEHPRVREK